MQTGTMQITLFLRQSRSLKDKRRVIKSIKDRLRNRFNVSVAETDANDRIQTAVLAVAIVGNERRYLQSTLEKILNFVRNRADAALTDYEQEIFC